MAEDKHSYQSGREQFQYYSTFDGEIVQIDESSSPDLSTPGGPRISMPPVPLIPGSLSLSDAIVKAGRRREAELMRERNEGDPLEGDDLSPRLMPDHNPAGKAEGQRSGDPLITAVSPGHFQLRSAAANSRRTARQADSDNVLDKTLVAIFEEGAKTKTGNFS